jgi:hypothetical protein
MTARDYRVVKNGSSGTYAVRLCDAALQNLHRTVSAADKLADVVLFLEKNTVP